jgi:acyl-CoA synthetase (AMP-forming)/AMP-acid ligase II
MTAPVNVAAHLPAMADLNPELRAVVYPAGRNWRGRLRYSHITFRQLNDDSNRLARGLERSGITRGTRCVLMVPPCLDFFSLTFALFKIGAVPVVIDPGMGVKNLGQCISESQPSAFIGVPKSILARRVLGWGAATIRTVITVGRHRFGSELTISEIRDRGRHGAFQMPAVAHDETAAILFTSGSTGVAKGVVYTYGVFAAQVEALRTLFGIQSGDIDLATFPLFALFGPALGMTAVIPDMDPTRPAKVNPRRIIEAVEQFGVTNFFGSPALLNRVARYGVSHNVKLQSLRLVTSAGAPVPAAVLESFSTMLNDGVQIFTPYGATEALPVACIGSREVLSETRALTERGAGVCIGRPVKGLYLKIIRISDDAIPGWDPSLELPVGQIGEIVVKGPWVTAAYFNRPSATALAKIRDADGGFWHRMGDVGYLDAHGRVWFCGRKSHRVETPGRTLFTIPCEAVFNTHPSVFRSALVGITRAGRTNPVICVELEASAKRQPWSQLQSELRAIAQAHEHTKPIETFLIHRAFPVDIRHNAKIFREKLATWAARRV